VFAGHGRGATSADVAVALLLDVARVVACGDALALAVDESVAAPLVDGERAAVKDADADAVALPLAVGVGSA